MMNDVLHLKLANVTSKGLLITVGDGQYMEQLYNLRKEETKINKSLYFLPALNLFCSNCFQTNF